MCDIFHLIVEVHHKKSLKIPKVIRICNSKKNRQHADQNKEDKRDKQRSIKHTHKTKDWVTRSGRVSSSRSNPFWDSKPELFSDIACLRITYQPCIVLFGKFVSGVPVVNYTSTSMSCQPPLEYSKVEIFCCINM